MFRHALILLLAVTLASCAKPPDRLVLRPVHYADITGWSADNQQDALAAFLKSCDAFARQPDTDATGQGMLLAPVEVWKTTCRRAELVPAGDAAQARSFFEAAFIPFRAYNNSSAVGLYTGYYEPLLMGSLTQHRPFMYPVYGLPPPGTPSYTRAQIDLGILTQEAPVLAYVDDPVQLFFLQIQGSGRIQLENGNVMRVGYAGTNGLPYTAIGRVLVQKNLMKKDDVTMPALRQWLYDHPSDMWQVMWENQSYVYFRTIDGGPYGAQKAPLTPGRSLAVDARFIPLGMPVFLDTMYPQTDFAPMTMDRRLMVAQDTGGAIRGPVRGDVFFGFGPAAEQLAGRMKAGGESTLLVPRPLAELLLKPPS